MSDETRTTPMPELDVPTTDAYDHPVGEPYHARPPAPSAEELAATAAAKQRIVDEIARLQQELADLANPPRPRWTCKRCGHTWRGQSARNPPLRCTRCASAYWNKEPTHPSARRPDDPPNPRWTRPKRARQSEAAKAHARELRKRPKPVSVFAAPADEPRGITTVPAWKPLPLPGYMGIEPPPRLDDIRMVPPIEVYNPDPANIHVSFMPPPRLDEATPESFARPTPPSDETPEENVRFLQELAVALEPPEPSADTLAEVERAEDLADERQAAEDALIAEELAKEDTP